MLRQLGAERLGISDEELGFVVSEVRVNEQKLQSIYLYDRVGGGAGFASSLGQYLPQMIRHVRQKLECPAGCQSACHNCLITHDTQYIAQELNRLEALEFVTQVWVASAELGESEKVLGDRTQLETRLLLPAIIAKTWRLLEPSVRIHPTVDYNDWDILSAGFVSTLYELNRNAASVELAVPNQTFEQLPSEIVETLIAYRKANLLEVLCLTETHRPGIVVQSSGGATQWTNICPEADTFALNAQFLRPSTNELIVKSDFSSSLES